MKYIGGCKTFFYFKKAIEEVIYIYNMDKNYQEQKLSLTISFQIIFQVK